MYKHILIATDGSELAQAAVTHGLALAKAIGAEVTIVTATKMWSAMEMTEFARHGKPHPIEEYEATAARSANRVLATCRDEAEKTGVRCATLHVPDTEPDEAIVGTAKSKGCDLILMASHGRGPVGRMLLGSVALKVLSSTKVPVQIVR